MRREVHANRGNIPIECSASDAVTVVHWKAGMFIEHERPTVAPVAFSYETDCIYLCHLVGKKIEWMVAIPQGLSASG